MVKMTVVADLCGEAVDRTVKALGELPSNPAIERSKLSSFDEFD